MSKMSNKKIGVTGTIGSGKTSVMKILAKSYKTISADEIVANLYKNKEFVIKINKLILNLNSDVLDKKRLSDMIFKNKKARKNLESIIHPLVRERIEKIFEVSEGIIFVEVPLLYEAKFDDLFDEVIVVVSSQKEIIKRLKLNRNYSERESLTKIASQFSTTDKIARANYVIYNDGSLKDLFNSVNKIVDQIKAGD